MTTPPSPSSTPRAAQRALPGDGIALHAAYDVVGEGPCDALLLPALSSISTRAEMHPLAARLAACHRCLVPDWPGFGDAPRAAVPFAPATLQAFLDRFCATAVRPGAVGVAAGHGAAYLVRSARRYPGLFARLVLVAPTWRGPLPTMQQASGTRLQRGLRGAFAAPVLGEALYRLNVSRPVLAMMMRAHVYADPAAVTDAALAAKAAVTRQPRARHGTAAFVTGALDPVASRAAFLALFAPEPPLGQELPLGPELPPILMLRPDGAPRRSGAEMDALAASGGVRALAIPGALAAHEEHPEAVAQAILGEAPD